MIPAVQPSAGEGGKLDEDRLPEAVLAKASLRGSEYAWPLPDVEDAIAAAKACGLTTLGGQAQFRFPDGTCELHWVNAQATERQLGETWDAYVLHSAADMTTQFRRVVASTDFGAEARDWPFLRAKVEAGVPVMDYLCFVLYFTGDNPQSGSGSTG